MVCGKLNYKILLTLLLFFLIGCVTIKKEVRSEINREVKACFNKGVSIYNVRILYPSKNDNEFTETFLFDLYDKEKYKYLNPIENLENNDVIILLLPNKKMFMIKLDTFGITKNALVKNFNKKNSNIRIIDFQWCSTNILSKGPDYSEIEKDIFMKNSVGLK